MSLEVMGARDGEGVSKIESCDDANLLLKRELGIAAPDQQRGWIKTVASTIPEQSCESHEEDCSTCSSSVSFLDEPEMPLLKFARLVGSLPRPKREEPAPLSKVCTCSTMGKVHTGDGGRTFDVLALGFMDGTIQLVDVRTGIDLCPPHILSVDTTTSHVGNTQSSPAPPKGQQPSNINLNSITALSFDAFGSTLAACQRNGSVAVWEFKWAPDPLLPTTKQTDNSTSGSTSSSTAPPLTMPDISNQTADSATELLRDFSTKVLTYYGPKLVSYPTGNSAFRFSYGLSSMPTCISLDPAYSRKRPSERTLICGFSDGRVVLTKKNLNLVGAAVTNAPHQTKSIMGGLFSGWTKPTSDTVIYQGKVADSEAPNRSICGIEAVSWRGSLVVWVDVSGIKVFDVESMARIAHIDRPSGARAALYHPAISNLKCNLCWESYNSILIGWGDCLMSLQINELSPADNSGGGANIGPAESQQRLTASSTLSTDMNTAAITPPTSQRKRTVDCVMAWELDCVACGVAPMDSDHVAVLGLVIPELILNRHDDEDEQKGEMSEENSCTVEVNTAPTVELQIVSRGLGTIESSDSLPLLYPPRRNVGVSSSDFNLLSSYTIPRRDNRVELSGRISTGQTGESFPSSSLRQKENRLEMYQKWSIDRVMCKSDAFHHPDLNASNKVPAAIKRSKSGGTLPQPPIMVVCCASDVVLVNTRDVDDAVAHARSQRNYRLALLRGWMNQPLMKKYSLNFLVNEYLISLIEEKTAAGLQLAARSCEVLLRGDIEMWEHWIAVLSTIPGGLWKFSHIPSTGLFALREFVPVRDPKLGSTFYELMLEKMFVEIEDLCKRTNSLEKTVISQSTSLFMTALLAWGPTSAIRERMRLMRWQSPEVIAGTARSPDSHYAYEQLAWELYRRKHQSATFKPAEADKILLDVLSVAKDRNALPESPPKNPHFIAAGIEYASASKWSNEEVGLPYSLDSLYNMSRVASRLARRVSMIVPAPKEEYFMDEVRDWSESAANGASEALAELCFMRGEYAEALQLYLVIGANRPKLDSHALLLATRNVRSKITSQNEDVVNHPQRFNFLLAMIEQRNLYHCLLDSNFLAVVGVKSSSSKKTKTSPVVSGEPSSSWLSPLVALIHLVGLKMASSFLVENCSVNEVIHNAAYASLPLYEVASQLSERPKLLFWYLQQVLLHRPEFYVGMSNMTVPPKEILDLHRTHLELHVKYHIHEPATSFKMSADTAEQSLLMDFLGATIINGSVRPQYARRLIEGKRREAFADADAKSLPAPKSFLSRELAFVIEKSGRCTDADSKEVLQLYLDGACSLPLAVAFAERSTEHSAFLWEALVSYCLDPRNETNNNFDDGHSTLFGALLEAAAQSGTDLAHLVSQIPPGMVIKGLRPMLVAAVADYRLKVKMHEFACDAFIDDKISLLRELAHRTRRAARVVGAVSPFDVAACRSTLEEQPNRNAQSLHTPMHKSRSLEQRKIRTRHAMVVPLR